MLSNTKWWWNYVGNCDMLYLPWITSLASRLQLLALLPSLSSFSLLPPAGRNPLCNKHLAPEFRGRPENKENESMNDNETRVGMRKQKIAITCFADYDCWPERRLRFYCPKAVFLRNKLHSFTSPYHRFTPSPDVNHSRGSPSPLESVLKKIPEKLNDPLRATVVAPTATMNQKSAHYNTIRPIRFEVLEKVPRAESNPVLPSNLGSRSGFLTIMSPI